MFRQARPVCRGRSLHADPRRGQPPSMTHGVTLVSALGTVMPPDSQTIVSRGVGSPGIRTRPTADRFAVSEVAVGSATRCEPPAKLPLPGAGATISSLTTGGNFGGMAHAPIMDPIGLGVVGLGRAFTLLRPAFLADPRFALVAAADPRPAARAAFAAEFGGRTYSDAATLAADPAVAAVYVATPHQCHAADACILAAAGKHVLVEKPMALDLAEADAMIDAAQSAGVQLIVGPCHSFDAPILLARALIASGRYGRLRMLQMCTYTDFLYRPRRAEELDTARGGGVVFNQAPHQVDIARLLGGGMLASLSAQCAAWDGTRPTEGAYSALLRFQDGAFASLTYSGYGHFDTDSIAGWIGEDGRRKDPDAQGAARRRLAAVGAGGEAALRAARGYGGAGNPVAYLQEALGPAAHPHFGLLIASCEAADLLPTPTGVAVHADTTRDFIATPPPDPPRREVLDALFAAVTEGRAPSQTGEWGRATLEACHAILRSAREGRGIALVRQVPA